ncbi:MAG: PDZ domain-containing protein, partial [Desulfobacteraceae bacterium]
MKNMKLGTKIGVGFGILIIIALVLGGMAVINMKGVSSETTMLAEEGVRVAEGTGNPARAAGIRSGDVIVQFGGDPVPSPQALRERAEAASPGRSVPVLLHREGTPVFIALPEEIATGSRVPAIPSE